MSWDFDLCDPVTRECLQTEEKHMISGGTCCLGGRKEMTLNITGNYSGIIANKMKDLGIVDENSHTYPYYFEGKSGAETTEPLKKLIASLKDDVDDDYWKPTEGNVKRALCGLLAFAQLRPDGVWLVC